MSSESEIVDVLSRVANIFLKAVDALENRLMLIEQRLDEMERSMSGGRAPAPQYQPSIPQDSRRPAPIPSTSMQMPQPQPAPRVEAYGNPQAQWGAPRQDSYQQPAPQGYQARPQPAGYQQGYQQQPPAGAPMQSQQPGAAPGPRPPSSPLNIRQAVTGELKDVFAKMRARAEGR